MSTGAKMDKQSRRDQKGGGNLVGRAPGAPRRNPGTFMGKSGQSDNRSTFRKKGQ